MKNSYEKFSRQNRFNPNYGTSMTEHCDICLILVLGSENLAAFNKTRFGIDHRYRNFLTLVDNVPVYQIGVHMAAKTLKKVDSESYHDPHKPVDQLLIFVYDHIDTVIFPAHGQEQRTVETRQPANSFRVGTTNRQLPTPPLQQNPTLQPTITYSYQSVNH